MASGSLIVIKRSGEDGQRYVLDSRKWCTIGSHPECDIIIHSQGVAKLHALVLYSADTGAQVFGLDESLPTVCPSKKASLFKDEGAKLERGDIFLVGERKFRFEEFEHSRLAMQDALSDSTNMHSTPEASKEGSHHAGFLSRSYKGRRSSLLVKDDVEEFRPCASTQTFLTARRMSLPASAVAEDFFASTRSPAKRAATGYQGRIQAQDTQRTPSKQQRTRSSKLQGLHRTPQSPRASELAASSSSRGSPVGTVLHSTDSDAGQQRMTPRRAKKNSSQVLQGKMTEEEYDRRMTPRRVTPATSRSKFEATELADGGYEQGMTPRKAGPTSLMRNAPKELMGAEYEQRMTPRKSGYEQRMTPRRAGPASSPTNAPKELRGAEYEQRMTPRRAEPASACPDAPDELMDVDCAQRTTPHGAAHQGTPRTGRIGLAVGAAHGSGRMTPKRRTRESLSKAREDVEIAMISNRVAAESPLFTRPPKRARTCSKLPRSGVKHRHALALGTPRRSKVILRPLFAMSEDKGPTVMSESSAEIAPLAKAIAEIVGDRQDASDEDDDFLVNEDFTPRRSIVTETRAEDFVRGPSHDSLEEILLTAKKTNAKPTSHSLTDDEAEVEEEKPSSHPEVIEAFGGVSPVLKAEAIPEPLLSTFASPRPGTIRIPEPIAADTEGIAEQSRDRHSMPRKRVGRTPIVRCLEVPTDVDADEDAAQKLFAGITPAARMLPRSQERTRARTAATESRAPTRSRLLHTPEKQVRSASAVKQCLSQKPRSAISKSARKGKRRTSSMLRKTVLFADTVGADIELGSGPHYSPPPKSRESSRYAHAQDETDSFEDIPSASPTRAASSIPLGPLPRPSPSTETFAASMDELVPTTATGGGHALGPPPSTPLGRLGLFFYPIRPAYPLLTNGDDMSATDSAFSGGEGSQDSPGSRGDSSSSDGAATPVSLPFTEPDSLEAVPAAAPPRRRSLLGGIASLGSYAAGSVLRRLSGAKGSEVDKAESPPRLEELNESNSSVDLAGLNDAESMKSSDEEGILEEVQKAADAEEAEKAEALKGDEAGEEARSPDRREAEVDYEPSEIVEGSQGHHELTELDISTDVERGSAPTTPRRQSLLGRAFDAVFGGSAKKEAEAAEVSAFLGCENPSVVPALCDSTNEEGIDRQALSPPSAPRISDDGTVGGEAGELPPRDEIPSPAPPPSAPHISDDGTAGGEAGQIPPRDEVPTPAPPPSAPHISDDGTAGGEAGQIPPRDEVPSSAPDCSDSASSVETGSTPAEQSMVIADAEAHHLTLVEAAVSTPSDVEANEASFSHWTVKELREYLLGLGYSLRGERKAELINLAVHASQPSRSNRLTVDDDGTSVNSLVGEGEKLSPRMVSARFSKHTVVELRRMLCDLGFDSTGRKADLIARLMEGSDCIESGATEPDVVVSNAIMESAINDKQPPIADNGNSGTQEYSSMTVKKLRALLHERHLSSTGRKDALVQRLIANEEESAQEAVTSAEAVSSAEALSSAEAETSTPASDLAEVDSMTVAQLRVALSSMDLNTVGKKAELKERLLGTLSSEVDVSNGASEEDEDPEEEAWKRRDAFKMTVVELRAVLRSNVMCAAGSKARLVQKVNTIQAGVRVTRRKRGEEDLVVCNSCEQGKACEAL